MLLSTAGLFALLVNLLLFGVYSCLVAVALYLLRSKRERFSPPVIAVILIWLLDLGRTISSVYEGYEAFIVNPRGPQDYFLNHNNRAIATYHNFMLITSGGIADLTLLWRLYIIWSRKTKVVALPAILLLSSLASGYGVVHFGGNGYGQDHKDPLEKLAAVYFASALPFNILVTSLIVGRLLAVSIRSKGQPDRRYFRIITALVESGAVYLLTFLLYIFTYVFKSNVSIIFLAVLPETAGIVPTLIMIQLSLGYRQDYDNRLSSQSAGAHTAIVFAQPRSTCGGETVAVPSRSVARLSRAFLDTTADPVPVMLGMNPLASFSTDDARTLEEGKR